MSWPKRDNPQWQEALKARATALFIDTAERHGLQFQWDDAAPVEVACTYPAQRGLDFPLSFWLSYDEFGCGGEHWYAIIFPADDPAKWHIISRVVEELVSGDARIALYSAVGRKRPYWSEIQLYDGKRWRSVSTGTGCAFPPIIRPSIFRNGHTTTYGGIRPAYGTLLLMAILILGAYLLLT